MPRGWPIEEEDVLIARLQQQVSEQANQIRTLGRELSEIRLGEVVVMPTSIEHARAMHLLAERYLKDNQTP